METPNYILTHGSEIAVNMRGLSKAIGFDDRYYPDWFQRRAELLNLTDGVDFITAKIGPIFFHAVSVATALAMLEGQHYKQKRDMCAPFIAELRALPEQETQPNLSAFVPALILSAGQVIQAAEGAPSTGSDTQQAPDPLLKIDTAGPVPLFQRGGKVAIFARAIYGLFQPSKEGYFSQWMKIRIEKFALVPDRDYHAFSEPSGTGRTMTGYVLSLDAAISILAIEPKGRADGLRAYLLEYKKQIRKAGLSTKGKLSDFVGMDSPFKAAPTTATEHVVLELGLFGWTPESIEVVNGAYSVETVAPESNEANTSPHPGDSDETVDYTTQEENAPTEAQESTESGESLESADEPYLEPVDSEEQAERIVEDDAALKGEIIPDTKGASMAALTARVQFLELTVGQLVTILQSQSRAIMGLNKSSEPMPEMTLRQKVNVLVNQQCRISGVHQEELFGWIYKQLANRYSIRVNTHDHQSYETHLQLAERKGFIDKVYAIVTSDEFKAYNGANELVEA